MTSKRTMWLYVGAMAMGLVGFYRVMIAVAPGDRLTVFAGGMSLGVALLYLQELVTLHRSKRSVSAVLPLDIMRRVITRLINDAKTATDLKERDKSLETVVGVWGIGQGFSEEALLSLSPEFVDLMIEIAEKKADLKERFWIDLLRQRREEFRHLPLPEGRGVTTGT